MTYKVNPEATAMNLAVGSLNVISNRVELSEDEPQAIVAHDGVYPVSGGVNNLDYHHKDCRLERHPRLVATEEVFSLDINTEVDRLFDDSSLPADGHPVAVIISGGVCAGKTTVRKQKYSTGYVLIDAADIFLSLSRGEYLPFPDAFQEPMDLIGGLVATRALFERRNIVTEIVGSEVEPVAQLIDALRSIGYGVRGEVITLDVAEAVRRNESRDDDNISAYFAEPFQRAWIIDACSGLAGRDEKARAGSSPHARAPREAAVQKILYIDMDGVLVDFKSGITRLAADELREHEGHLDDVPGIFALMDPMPGAIEALRELSQLFDTYLLSTAPWKNPSAWSDKLLWVQQHLGAPAHKRLILSHHKDLNRGDFLIDDGLSNGADRFIGEHIHFGNDPFSDWPAVMRYLRVAAAG